MAKYECPICGTRKQPKVCECDVIDVRLKSDGRKHRRVVCIETGEKFTTREAVVYERNS